MSNFFENTNIRFTKHRSAEEDMKKDINKNKSLDLNKKKRLLFTRSICLSKYSVMYRFFAYSYHNKKMYLTLCFCLSIIWTGKTSSFVYMILSPGIGKVIFKHRNSNSDRPDRYTGRKKSTIRIEPKLVTCDTIF